MTNDLDDRHLPECPHHGDIDGPCDWCLWALHTPELATIRAIGDDTRVLLGCDTLDTIPAVVAVARLIELLESVCLDEVRTSSARQLIHVELASVTSDLSRLHRRIDQATAPNGPIEANCRRTAGALAVVALQCDPRRLDEGAIAPSLRRDIERLTATLSVPMQLTTMLPVVEQLHHCDLPTLRTQPEWQRRPRSRAGHATLAARQLASTHLEPGSLEALVVEATIAEHTQALMSIGETLVDLGTPVTISRPLCAEPHRGRTRELLWRVSRFEWHLTFVDTGLSSCWAGRTDGEHRCTDVPWVVALAIDTSLRAGLVSALHPTIPAPFDEALHQASW